MFDWILCTPLNTITNFFSWRFQIKVNDFRNLFKTINFSYQYLSEAKTCLEPSRTSAMELSCEKIFCAKFTRKHLCRSLFLIKLQVFILQLHWKKGLPHRCFLMNFASLYRTPPRDCFCSTERYFTNKIEKNPLRKKMKTACKKNNDTRRTKT